MAVPCDQQLIKFSAQNSPPLSLMRLAGIHYIDQSDLGKRRLFELYQPLVDYGHPEMNVGGVRIGRFVGALPLDHGATAIIDEFVGSHTRPLMNRELSSYSRSPAVLRTRRR